MKRLVFLLSLITFFLFPIGIFAQEETATDEAVMRVERSDYVLPYPGLLPDNPLYIIKTLRDNIIGLLISDPLKKAEFDLLQADKRLQAGVYLINKDRSKIDLAHTTISKGQNYFDQAIEKIKQADERGMNADDMFQKVSSSGVKHEEVLSDIAKKLPDNEKQKIDPLLQRIEELQKKVDTYESN